MLQSQYFTNLFFILYFLWIAKIVLHIKMNLHFMFPENHIRQIFIRIMISTPHSLMIIYREVLDHFYSILWAGNCSYSLVHIVGINKVTNNFWHKRALGFEEVHSIRSQIIFLFHSLNNCVSRLEIGCKSSDILSLKIINDPFSLWRRHFPNLR